MSVFVFQKYRICGYNEGFRRIKNPQEFLGISPHTIFLGSYIIFPTKKGQSIERKVHARIFLVISVVEKLTSIKALASTSVRFSFWNIVKNCKKASIGTTCLRDVSTPAEFLKMEAAAKALYTFLFSFRVLKSVKSVELFRVREPIVKKIILKNRI